MGQDTSGTSLVANAVATKRDVVCRFMVDWEDDGFSDPLTGWTDESSHVKEAKGDIAALDFAESLAAVGHGVSDECTVICRNPEESNGNSGLRFSATNANGSLYAYIQDGRINMKRAVLEMGYKQGVTPQRLRQITGYITDAKESLDKKSITFKINDRGVDAGLTRASTALYTDVTASEYLAELCSLFGRDAVVSGDRLFDNGMFVVPYYWLDDDTVWDETHLLAQAHAGRCWFDKDGVLHFDDGTHWVKPQSDSWDSPAVSQATFTTATFKDLAPRYDLRSVYNHIIVEYQGRYVGQQQPVFATSEGITLGPGETARPYKAKFRYPTGAVLSPVADIDYQAIRADGTDITSQVTVGMTAYASYADLELTNADAYYAAYLTKLEIRGNPLLTEESVKYEVEDLGSIGYYGRRTYPVRRNPYIQTYRHAEMLGDFLLSRFLDPILVISLRGELARPWLEPGDRVTVTETLTDISEDFFIGRIGWSWKPAAQSYLMDLELIRRADLFTNFDYFILGTSTYGTNARLFW